MTFIINNKIYFRSVDGAIWDNDAEDEQRHLALGKASSRLLAYFIENQGKVLSRTDIFEAVWEKYGLHSSNNTLNQYISLLRRVLAKFGLGMGVIKTIPKTGFLLSTDIHIAAVKEHNKTSTGTSLIY